METVVLGVVMFTAIVLAMVTVILFARSRLVATGTVKVTIEAMQSIELKVGQSSVKVDQVGVTVKGMMIKEQAEVLHEVKGMITKVDGSAMVQVTGGIIMIG